MIRIIKRFLGKKKRKIFDKGFHEWHRAKNKSRLQLTLSPTTIEEDVIDSVTQLVGWHKPKLNNLTFCRRKKTWLENLTDFFFVLYRFRCIVLIFFFCYRNGVQLLVVQDSPEIEHETTLARYLQVVYFFRFDKSKGLAVWRSGNSCAVAKRIKSKSRKLDKKLYRELRRFWS